MALWRRWRALPALDRRLVCEAAPLVLAVRLALWLLPFRWVVWLIGCVPIYRPIESTLALCSGPNAQAQNSGSLSALVRARPRPSLGSLPTPSARRVALAVASASRYVPAASCLTQALAARALLRRYGHLAELCIGVARPADRRLAAHAWVECNGVIVIGDTGDLAAFRTLGSLSNHRR